MKMLNIEDKNRGAGIVRIQTVPNGNVEIVLTEPQDAQSFRNGKGGPGGPVDKILTTIPKAKISEVAEFLKSLTS